MKLKVEYEVESKTKLAKETEILLDDKAYTFYLNEEGFISKIAITAPVKDPTKFYSTIIQTPGQVSKAHFYIKKDDELYDEIIKEFQDLESLLSFSFNLRGINWNSDHYEVICETDEERDLTNIFSWSTRKEFPDEPVALTEDQLRETLSRRKRLSRLTTFMSFYKEGKNDYHARKFINAFFNFYFILEGMYGKGKTKNRDVANEFKKTVELREFIENIIENHIKVSPEHLAKVTQMLKDRHMTIGIDAIVELIVRTRGDLHHFINNPNRLQGTPLNHPEFHSAAFIVMGLSLNAILFRIVDINSGNIPP